MNFRDIWIAVLTLLILVLSFKIFYTAPERVTDLAFETDQQIEQMSDYMSESRAGELYYQSTVGALQSPHGLRLELDKGNEKYVIVDVRRADFYEAGHITTAVNIPTDTTQDELLTEFQTLQDENPDKTILIYCYSSSCLNGRKVGRFLTGNGIFVKELSIGYNEWVGDHEMWNYPNEIYDISNYITTGSEPGEFQLLTNTKNTECGNEAFAC